MSDTTQQALRHFAEYGLRAVSVAIDHATRAHMASHEADYLYWLGICRELDPVAAAKLESSQSGSTTRLIG